MDKLIILDLDETLFYSEHNSRMSDASYDFITRSFPIFEGEYYTMFRPHLGEFIKWLFDNFNVAVYTAASRDYAELLLTKMDIDLKKLKFLWTRENCTIKYDTESNAHLVYKKLAKLKKKYNLDRCLMIDDKPNLIDCYGNVIAIKPFYGDSNDRELMKLIIYLDSIKELENWRTIDKRNCLENIKL